MAHLIPVPLVALTATLTVRAELRQEWRQVYLVKPLTSLLVIGVAALSFLGPSVDTGLAAWVLVGLVFSMGGDIALMFASSRAFMVGLILFLLAQLVYTIGFTVPNGFHLPDLATGAALLALAVAVYLYLLPGLGKMRLPVLVYILVICAMVNRALSAFFGHAFTLTQAWLLSTGALLFWLSDLLLGISRFRHPLTWNRLGLFLYFGGQMLIALSPSYSA